MGTLIKKSPPKKQLSATHLTSRQLAERWGYHEFTLSVWRKKGIGPKFYKLSARKVVYLISDVEEFEQKNAGKICD